MLDRGFLPPLQEEASDARVPQRRGAEPGSGEVVVGGHETVDRY